MAGEDSAQPLIGPTHAPRLRGVQIKDRWGILLSPEDLSTTLVGQPVDGVYGYQPEPAKSADGHPLDVASQVILSGMLYAK